MADLKFNIDTDIITKQIAAKVMYTRAETVLVLSGSGANITYELGAAAELQKHMEIKTIYACSAGSIIGLAIALGINLDNFAKEMIDKIGSTSVLRGRLLLALYRLKRRGYMFKKDIRDKLLNLILTGKNRAMRFVDLPFDFNVVATCCDNSRRIVFNATNTPTVSVLDAVMASSAIPLIYPTVEINGVEYADGIFSNDYPYDLAPAEDSIGVYITVPRPKRTGSGMSQEFKKVMFMTRMSMSNPNGIPEDWLRKTIFCRISDDNNINVFTTITPLMFNNNFQFGTQQTRDFLSRTAVSRSPTLDLEPVIIDQLCDDNGHYQDDNGHYQDDGKKHSDSHRPGNGHYQDDDSCYQSNVNSSLHSAE